MTARVTILLPRIVCRLTGAPHEVEVEADDTLAACAALRAAHPGVTNHLWDGAGDLRVNVLCALDGERTRLERPEPVRDGSLITFVGSVAGG